MTLDDPFHIGLMVPDIERANVDLARATGLEMLDPEEVSGICEFPGGRFPWRNRIAYSRKGGMRQELIEVLEPAGWETVPGGLPVNHVGHWVDDLDAASAQLESAGMPLVVKPVDEGPQGWCYHLNPHTGVAIEICSEPLLGDFLRGWWRTGRFPAQL